MVGWPLALRPVLKQNIMAAVQQRKPSLSVQKEKRRRGAGWSPNTSSKGSINDRKPLTSLQLLKIPYFSILSCLGTIIQTIAVYEKDLVSAH
jgi:hypothetical protein